MNHNYRGIGKVLDVILRLCFVFGIILLILIVPILKYLGFEITLFYLFIYPIGIGFLVLMYQFMGLFQSLSNNDPFCKNNVTKIGIAMSSSFGIAIFIFLSFLVAIYIYQYRLSFVICLLFMDILFLGVGIALYILRELFKEAISYKEENELTI